jgi:hypothetical protein
MALEIYDWRLQGQQRYLQGATLEFRQYQTYSKTWDHDHCDFCGARFMVSTQIDALREGYTTTDQYYWICGECFEDFREMFQWVVNIERR